MVSKRFAAGFVASFLALSAQAQVVSTQFNPGEGFSNVATNSAATNPTLGGGWTTSDRLTLVDRGNNQFLVLDGGESATFTVTGLVIGQRYDLRVGLDLVGYRSPVGNTGQSLLQVTNTVGLPTRSFDENLADTCNPSAVNANGLLCQGTYGTALAGVTRSTANYPVFTATSTTLGLTFRALVNNGTGAESHAAIDNVRVAVTAVPEAETWAMFMAGLGVMGLMIRRQAR